MEKLELLRCVPNWKKTLLRLEGLPPPRTRLPPSPLFSITVLITNTRNNIHYHFRIRSGDVYSPLQPLR